MSSLAATHSRMDLASVDSTTVAPAALLLAMDHLQHTYETAATPK